jgi:hypothetical protein
MAGATVPVPKDKRPDEYIPHNQLVADVEKLRVELTALIVDVTAIRTKLLATHAKLDADAGVTDTNYAATNNPAALTVVAANVDTASDLVSPLVQ